MLLSPTEKFKKDYKRFSTVKNLFQLLRPNKKLCISIVVISLVHTVLNISTAFYYMILIDKILPEYAFNSLVIISECISSFDNCQDYPEYPASRYVVNFRKAHKPKPRNEIL